MHRLPYAASALAALFLISSLIVSAQTTPIPLTDALLTWQTEALLERETGRDGIVVHVRPELVVEVALDGVQVSTRYAGGVALRFARVRRYRDDKGPDEADTIDTVRALLPSSRG